MASVDIHAKEKASYEWKRIKCPMKEWCEASSEELKKHGSDENLIVNVDDRCDSNPSLRSLDKSRCPFGFVWYATGLPLLKSKP